MKQVWIYPFALLSLANAVVDSDKIFTQDTTLDSSYASITSTPASGEVLEWGEIKGGSKDSPITLSTTQALNILAINNANGGVTGIGSAFSSYARLNGDITFSSLSGSPEAIGIFIDGFGGLENNGSLRFKEIKGKNVIGVSAFVIQQNGTLAFGSMQGDKNVGSAIGIGEGFLTNQANASITFDSISASSVYAIYVGEITNLGNISIGNLVGNEVVGIKGEIQNSGKLQVDSISATTATIGLESPEMQNTGTINYKTISSGNLAVGMNLGGALNSGNITFSSITSNNYAIGMYGSMMLENGGSVNFGEISAPKAFGFYDQGGVGGESGSVVFESIRGAVSYGILLNQGTFVLNGDDSMLVWFKEIESNVAINNIAGDLQIGGKASAVFGKTAPTQTNSAIYNNMPNAKYTLNRSTIDTAYQYAFYANEDANVYVNFSQSSDINAQNYSFGGKTHLNLGINSQLTLRTGGVLASLQSSISSVDLFNSGYSKRLIIQNFQAKNTNFKMHLDLNTSQGSGYDGGAFYDESKNPLSTGSSAFLQIDSSSTTSQVNNTLSLALSNKTNLAQKYVLLASVSGANRDNITFNSLSDRQTIAITPTSGYQAEGLEIGRYDDEKTQTNYFYLVANPYDVSTTAPSTPTTPNTPSQPTTQEEVTNSLIYNPNQSYLLSTFDWGKTRFAKLRDETRSGRIWADLGAEYWQYNGTQASEEGFIDFMVGGDYIFSFAKGRNALGVAVEVTGEFITQNQVLNNQPNKLEFGSTFLSVALYNVLMLDSGVYSHTVFRVGGGGGEFEGDSVMIGAEDFSQEATIYSFSQKVGKRFFLSPQNNGFFADLSALVAVGYAESSLIMQEESWYAPWGSAEFLSISSNASFVNQNKIEALIGYKGATNSFFSFDMSAGVGLVSNHCIGGEMRYQSQDYNVEFANTPYVGGLEVSANFVARMGDWIDTFVSVSSTWSKQYNEVIDFSAGIKLRFGSI